MKDRSCAPCLCDVIRVDGTFDGSRRLFGTFVSFSFSRSLAPLDLVRISQFRFRYLMKLIGDEIFYILDTERSFERMKLLG